MSGQESRRAYEWVGHEVVGPDGVKIGKVDAIYVDDRTDRPEWVAVKMSVFGGRIRFVPFRGATARGDELQVGYDKTVVQGSPGPAGDGVLSPEEVDQLYAHYGLSGVRPPERVQRNDSILRQPNSYEMVKSLRHRLGIWGCSAPRSGSGSGLSSGRLGGSGCVSTS